MDSAWFRGVWVVLVTTGGAAAYPKCEGFSQLATQMKERYSDINLRRNALWKLRLKKALMEG